MKKTKEKILTSALKLFNQDGLVNVRLQHIADEAFVSVGNLAYHFSNKEAILFALYEMLRTQQEALLTEYRVVPLFENIDRLLRSTFILQQNYVFFFLDTLEIVRAYPSIAQQHQQHIAYQLGQLRIIVDFNTARGALITEPHVGVFDHLARQIWMTMDFWRYQQSVRAIPLDQEQAYLTQIWNLLIPYFTVMGEREYQQMLEKPYDFYF